MSRSISDLVADYRRELDRCGMAMPTGPQPGAAEAFAAVLRMEVLLWFLVEHHPDYPVDRAADLLNGYELVNLVPPDAISRARYAVLRHLCVPLAAPAGLSAARQAHALHPATFRVGDVVRNRAARLPAVLDALVDFIRNCLDRPPPFERHRIEIAELDKDHTATLRVPGEPEPATVRVALPLIPGLDARVAGRPRLGLPSRRERRLEFSDAEIAEACLEVDRREAEASWPRTVLPQLNLADRWRDARVRGLPGHGFRWPGGFVLQGLNHVVGMLSARKTTFAWALIFAALRKYPAARILVVAKDVVTAAAMEARLRNHDEPATIIASDRNRERHLQGVARHAAAVPGAGLPGEAVLSGSLGAACPLIGFQSDPPTVLSGKAGRVEWPSFGDIPGRLCRRFNATGKRHGYGEACPLWVDCRIHEQQRRIPAAHVVITTPPAFLLTRPDAWVSPVDPHASGAGAPGDSADVQRPLWLEAAQWHFDLVIVDEADAVQKWFDQIATQDVALMKADRDSWSAIHKDATLRDYEKRSGAPFRSREAAQFVDADARLTQQLGLCYHLLEAGGGRDPILHGILRRRPVTGWSLLTQFYWVGRDRAELAKLARTGATEAAVTLAVDTVLDAVTAFSQPDSYRGRFSVWDGGRLDLGKADREFGALAVPVAEIGEARWALRDAMRILRDDIAPLDEVVGEILVPALRGPLNCFAWRLRPDNLRIRGMPRDPGARERRNALDLVFALAVGDLLRTFGTHALLSEANADEFELEQGYALVGAANLRRYRGLLPAAASGATYGLRYEAEETDRPERGGRISVFSNFAPGRVALLRLADILAPEGIPGPAVLLLSGTSWAGGSRRELRPSRDGGVSDELVDASAPLFDIQVPVCAILEPPAEELARIGDSIVDFEKILVREVVDGAAVVRQIRISGAQDDEKRANLEHIARHLATAGRNGRPVFLERWDEAARAWGEEQVQGRRRALCITNSYGDASLFSDRLQESLRFAGDDWSVFCAVPDTDDGRLSWSPAVARPLPRSLMEDFGGSPERSILVAPLSVIDRGHNITVVVPGADDGAPRHVAAISSVYFLHRTHPRPDDLDPVVAAVNRFAVRCLQEGVDLNGPDFAPLLARLPAGLAPVTLRNRALRLAGQKIFRDSLAWRRGYGSLGEGEQAQFGWNWLTSFWQAVGRLIRGGVPAQVIFVDRAFAPNTLGGAAGEAADDERSSVVLRAKFELEAAFAREPGIARPLYEPLHGLLAKAAELIT